ncbi:MAG TPA: DUF4202 domain-containing protein [Chryseosolibacter sp.]
MSPQSSTGNFEQAIAAIDSYHERDPNTELYEGKVLPKELIYASHMSNRLKRFAPDADEAVKLAARCQHIGRWEIPRDKYPMDRKGYLQWRNEAKAQHARIAEKILLECGYGAEAIERVKALILKKELHSNPNTQLLEDLACLIFLEHYLEDFSAKHEQEKVIDILKKTMRKMSDKAKKSVDKIVFSPKIRSMIEQALA